MSALQVGLTGGIGTGKTTIAKVFESMGIPVLEADGLAKRLMQDDPELRQTISHTFGSSVYENEVLQSKVLADIVFKDKGKLNRLNALVHPKVIEYGRSWLESRQTPYAIKEAAILIESGSYTDLDLIIGVRAPLEIRIQRTMQRDRITRELVMERMANQMDNDEKMKYCTYVIENDGQQSVIDQCIQIHQSILKLTNTKS